MKDLLEPIKTVCFIFFFDLCLRLKCSAIIFTVSLKSRLFALFSCRWQGSQGEAGAPGSKGSKVSAAMFSFKSAEHSVLINSLPLMRLLQVIQILDFLHLRFPVVLVTSVWKTVSVCETASLQTWEKNKSSSHWLLLVLLYFYGRFLQFI